jgi:hypothetical protein
VTVRKAIVPRATVRPVTLRTTRSSRAT